MRLFGRRNEFREMDEAKALAPVAVKGVDIQYSDSHDDYFARNLVAIRTVSTLSVGSYGMMYRRQPAVRSVVDFLARNIAQLNPKVYERVGDTDRVDLTMHPLAVLLRNPNPGTTRFVHIRDTVSDLAIYDRAYWAKMRQGGRVTAVARIPADKVHVDYSTGTRRYLLADGRELPRRDLVVFAGYNPDTTDDGVSPLETLRQILLEESAAVTNREHMWNNAARASGWIERPLDAPEWSDIARERFRTDLEATMSGARNAGRIGVLEEGMTWNASSFSPEETQYIDSRKLTREEVALTYFGPVAGQSFLQATGTGTEATHRQVYQDVLGPWLAFLEGEIELQLLPEIEPFTAPGRVYVEFNLHAKLKGSFQEQAESLVTAVGVPYMTVNEGRARLNLPQIDGEWADQPVQPLNVMYGGQPAVTVPVDEPATASIEPQAKDLARLERITTDHAALFRKHFDRMERVVASAKEVDQDRWVRELTADLYVEAQHVARQAGVSDPSALPALVDVSRAHAVSLTADIAAKVADGEDIHDLFDHARTVADVLAASVSHDLANFAATFGKEHPS